MTTKPVSIIIPTYNEKENVVSLIKSITGEFRPAEIIVVDDDSPDNTAGILKNEYLASASVRIIRNIPRIGLTGSIQKGIDQAQEKYVAWMDADFTHPPDKLIDLYRKIGNADLVIGSWLVKGGHDLRQSGFSRLYSRTINLLCRKLFFSNIRCYTSGLFMARKTLFSSIRLTGDYGEYCINLVVSCLNKGKKVVEAPIDIQSRRKGKSKTTASFLGFFIYCMKYLATIFLLKIKYFGK